MSKCDCGVESFRIRTIFHEANGRYVGQTTECPQCAPGSFEPQWLRDKIVPAYEAYPERYRKSYSEDGAVCYTSTDEARADYEAKILRPNPDDVAAKEKALQRRREWAKSQPKKLTSAQLESINSRRQQILASPAAQAAGVHAKGE